VIGVDISAEAVADARRNAAINRITKAEFRAGAVEDVLEELVRSAQFHDILAVIGERFPFLFLFPLFDVPFLWSSAALSSTIFSPSLVSVSSFTIHM
jgi:hypothetical protein